MVVEPGALRTPEMSRNLRQRNPENVTKSLAALDRLPATPLLHCLLLRTAIQQRLLIMYGRLLLSRRMALLHLSAVQQNGPAYYAL